MLGFGLLLKPSQNSITGARCASKPLPATDHGNALSGPGGHCGSAEGRERAAFPIPATTEQGTVSRSPPNTGREAASSDSVPLNCHKVSRCPVHSGCCSVFQQVRREGSPRALQTSRSESCLCEAWGHRTGLPPWGGDEPPERFSRMKASQSLLEADSHIYISLCGLIRKAAHPPGAELSPEREVSPLQVAAAAVPWQRHKQRWLPGLGSHSERPCSAPASG